MCLYQGGDRGWELDGVQHPSSFSGTYIKFYDYLIMYLEKPVHIILLFPNLGYNSLILILEGQCW